MFRGRAFSQNSTAERFKTSQASTAFKCKVSVIAQHRRQKSLPKFFFFLQDAKNYDKPANKDLEGGQTEKRGRYAPIARRRSKLYLHRTSGPMMMGAFLNPEVLGCLAGFRVNRSSASVDPTSHYIHSWTWLRVVSSDSV